MNKLLASLALLAFASAAHAQPQLDGKWVSDRERSMAFNEQRARLDPKTVRFLTALFGLMEVTFSGEQVRRRMPDWDIVIDGKTHRMIGFDATSPYRLAYSSESDLVVVSKDPVSGKEGASIYHFESADVFWIYSGGAGKDVPDFHLREYFHRVK